MTASTRGDRSGVGETREGRRLRSRRRRSRGRQHQRSQCDKCEPGTK